LQELARGLSALVARLEAADAAQAAFTLAQAIRETRDLNALRPLARGLSSVAARLEPRDAAQATATLLAALKDIKYLDPMAEGLSALAGRLEARDAAQTAAALLAAMKEFKGPYALDPLARGLSAMAGRLEPRDAAALAAEAVPILLRAMQDDARDPGALRRVAEGLSALAGCLEARDAAAVTAQAAAAFLHLMKDLNDPLVLQSLARGFSAVLSAVPPAENPSRSATAASSVVFPAGIGQPLAALALVLPAAEPPPCRLSDQQLVELLKMPTCVAEARRVILDQLGNRYRRSFADVWEFVRFAREQNLDLDFTTPPKRPEPPAAKP
jgi:hypothetical protein